MSTQMDNCIIDAREYVHVLEDFVATCVCDKKVSPEVILSLCRFFEIHLNNQTFIELQKQDPVKFQSDIELVLKILNILLFVRTKLDNNDFSNLEDFEEISTQNPTYTFKIDKLQKDEKTNNKILQLLSHPKHIEEAGKRSFFLFFLLKIIDFLVNNNEAQNKDVNLATFYWTHLEIKYKKQYEEEDKEWNVNNEIDQTHNNTTHTNQVTNQVIHASVKFIFQILANRRNAILESTKHISAV